MHGAIICFDDEKIKNEQKNNIMNDMMMAMSYIVPPLFVFQDGSVRE